LRRFLRFSGFGLGFSVVRSSGSQALRLHNPAAWPKPKGYAQRRERDGTSCMRGGQVGWDPVTSVFAASDFADEVRQALTNVVVRPRRSRRAARPDRATHLVHHGPG
jgi:hypothetical protein